jgi:cytochrome c biogenesis protein
LYYPQLRWLADSDRECNHFFQGDKMTKKDATPWWGDKIWNFLSSVKLTVVVLLTLAATSIVGTLIPQNNPPDWYYHAYGETLFKLVDFLHLHDMYHSGWFRFLIMALAVNIIVCSVNLFPKTWKIVRIDKPKFKPDSFRKLKTAKTYKTAQSVDALMPAYEAVLAKRFRYHRVESAGRGACIYAESGRWTRLGVYAVHASIVFLLVGALVGSFFGFDGYVNIGEGEAVNVVRMRNSDEVQLLDFEIRCDDFDVSFYDNGAPREFRSSLAIVEDGKTVHRKDIIVNDPLRYKGINMFQSSYGKLPPQSVVLRVIDPSTGKIDELQMVMGEQLALPGDRGSLVINEFKESYHYRGHQLHDTFLGVWTPREGMPVDIVMPYPFPEFDLANSEEVQRISAFQATSRAVSDELPEKITLSFVSKESGMVYNLTVKSGEAVDIPEGLGTFRVLEMTQTYKFQGQPIGEAVVGSLKKTSGEKETVVLPVRFEKFDRMRQGDVFISVVDFNHGGAEPAVPVVLAVSEFQDRHYTGLQVTKDPGIWLVYAGFIFMIAGCYITFFTSHQRVYIEVAGASNTSTVIVSGRANKNKLGMQKVVNNLTARLQKITV